MNKQGYKAIVCYGSSAAIKEIEDYAKENQIEKNRNYKKGLENEL